MRDSLLHRIVNAFRNEAAVNKSELIAWANTMEKLKKVSVRDVIEALRKRFEL